MRRLIPLLLLCGAAIAQTLTLPNAVPMPAPEIQYLNAAGQPLAGAFLCSFAAGTSTPLATYTDSTAGTPNTNPIVLDSNGRASVWVGSSLYKFVLYVGGNGACPGTGAVQWSQDNVSDTTLYFANWVKTAGTATVLSYTAPLSGAVQETVSARLAQRISVRDFGAKGDGSTDDSAAILAAMSIANSYGGTIYFPSVYGAATTYNTSSVISISHSNIHLVCDGNVTIQYTGSTATAIVSDPSGSSGVLYYDNSIENCTIAGNANVQYALKINSQHHSKFSNVHLGNVTQACMWVGWAVETDYPGVYCTHNDFGGSWTVTPVNNIIFAGLDSSHYATSGRLYGIGDFASGTCLKLVYTQAIHIDGGAYEYCGVASIETAASGGNVSDVFTANDLESPGQYLVYSNSCYECVWNGVLAGFNSTAGINYFGVGRGNVLNGGQWNGLTIVPAAFNTTLNGVLMFKNGTGCNAPAITNYSTVVQENVFIYDCTATTFTTYNGYGLMDTLNVINQQGAPTQAYIRQSSAQGTYPLLSFTDPSEVYVKSYFDFLGDFFAEGAYGPANVGVVGPSSAGQTGYIQWYNGTQVLATMGNNATLMPLVLSNGAKFQLYTLGASQATQISNWLGLLTSSNAGPPASVPGCSTDITFAVAGAQIGDTVAIAPAIAIPAGFQLTAFVSAANTVTGRWCQFSGTAADPDGGSGTNYRIDVWQH